MNRLDELKAVKQEYRTLFGDNSLDNVTLLDPLRINNTSVERAIRVLKSAMKKKRPLDNTPGEVEPIY